eukprot:CAMPEP_0204872812 /NCGR_PEP_ID=MMETSP1348-20121228/38946_1 /ASSEMBLY_ACC=CAM_ASM_000700 /TAXON_ID=215587 /ORGANISM="Aplanochytrium stocchinoi, Strain GSBS06" /LENGTH=39 /DNA_ID= /DNA_START= /DNA_END= /DNA_ORIENTATION=
MNAAAFEALTNTRFKSYSLSQYFKNAAMNASPHPVVSAA